MTVAITEHDFQIVEGTDNNILSVTVSFSTAVENPIKLNFIPLTYDQFYSEGLTLPNNFPERNIDASGTLISITLL